MNSFTPRGKLLDKEVVLASGTIRMGLNPVIRCVAKPTVRMNDCRADEAAGGQLVKLEIGNPTPPSTEAQHCANAQVDQSDLYLRLRRMTDNSSAAPERQMHMRGLVFVVLSAIAFSFAGILTKAIQSDLWVIASWRGFVGGLLIIGYVYWRAKWNPKSRNLG